MNFEGQAVFISRFMRPLCYIPGPGTCSMGTTLPSCLPDVSSASTTAKSRAPSSGQLRAIRCTSDSPCNGSNSVEKLLEVMSLVPQDALNLLICNGKLNAKGKWAG